MKTEEWLGEALWFCTWHHGHMVSHHGTLGLFLSRWTIHRHETGLFSD